MMREAVASDAPAIAALANELGYPATVVQIQERLARLAGDEQQYVVVYEVHGQVLAWMQLHIGLSLASGTQVEILALLH